MGSSRRDMRLAIAILGLAGSLSAQIVCRSVDAKDRPDLSFDASRIRSMSLNFASADFSNVLASQDFSPPYFSKALSLKVRCWEHISGTLSMNGKIVHDLYREMSRDESWLTDGILCRPRNGEYRRTIAAFQLETVRQDTTVAAGAKLPDFCRKLTTAWGQATGPNAQTH